VDGEVVLVTGANGFVGGRVAARLAEEGAAVRGLVRRPGQTEVLDRPGIEEVTGDFTDPDDARRAVEGVDSLVHCAATAGEDLESVRRVNRDGTRTIARAAIEADVRAFVHISTGSVYAGREGDNDIDEGTPRTTEGPPYGVTKAEAEVEVERAAREGLRTTILRPPAVLGWGPTSTWGQRVPERIGEGELPIGRGAETSFAWVHVDDLAEAVRLALVSPEAEGRTYNVVGGHTTIARYVGDVSAWFPDAPEIELVGEAAWSGRMPADRIARELGWQPRVSYEEAMAESARRWGAGTRSGDQAVAPPPPR
jgi:2-alkyl-3-oxoalkanoate reductase